MGKVFVLGVNGSPHKNGKTFRLLSKMLEHSAKKSAETKLIQLAGLDIRPCLGCYSIDPKKCVYPCRIKDGMQKIYLLMEKADAVVLASPVYWFNMTGLMKNFIDRLCCAENNGLIYEGKVAALVVSKEDGGEMLALMSTASALNHLGFLLMPYTIYSPGSEAGKNWVPSTLKFTGEKIVEVSELLKKINWPKNP